MTPTRTPVLLKTGSVLIGGGSLIYFGLFLLFGTRLSVSLGLDFFHALAMDTSMSLLFFIQHSGMVRTGFKKRMSRIMPESWIPAVYALASGTVLIPAIAFWQGTAIFYIPQDWLRWTMHVLFLLAVGGFYWGVRSLPEFDSFGIRTGQVQTGEKLCLKIKGPYRFTRHPLYFFALVMIWSSTVFSWDRLWFNLLWSGWITLGAWLEEKDLARVFGKDYVDYQNRVPMLIPGKCLKI